KVRSTVRAGKNLIRATLVDRLEWAGRPHPDIRIEGNRILIPDLGSITLFPMEVRREFRTVRALQVALSGAWDGQLEIGYAEIGGAFDPDANIEDEYAE